MQFSVAIVTLLATAVSTLPTEEKRQADIPCPGPYSFQCCGIDVLGDVDLDCVNSPSTPTNAIDFGNVCSAIGRRPRCCFASLIGQASLCQTFFWTQG
ncbi:trihydrophobin [Fusarium globosum]|uniref:Trihydrophobin n=1 Tax=Fusarium globosum TaxID=78864 RepID=A0A8H5Y1A3_9HYPO|nr:trihydrophobin [Fusarium globosum]